MDFEKLKKFKPEHPLKIVKRNLSLDPKMIQKTSFTEEDLKIDYRRDRLELNEIEIPVFKNTYVRPFMFKGKFIRYEKDNLGAGFYRFVFYNGKINVMKKDRRYTQEEIDRKNDGMLEFWIGYNHEKKHYYVIETEDEFKEKYAIVEEEMKSEDVLKLLLDFELFIVNFLSKTYKEELQKTNKINGDLKVNYSYQILKDLKEYMPTLKDYHQLLNIMDDINDTTYLHIKNMFQTYESNIDLYTKIIEEQLDINQIIRELGSNYSIFEPIEKFIAKIETNFLGRGYTFDPDKKDVFPNFMEVHLQRQISDHFEDDESLETTRQEFLAEQMKKTRL